MICETSAESLLLEPLLCHASLPESEALKHWITTSRLEDPVMVQIFAVPEHLKPLAAQLTPRAELKCRFFQFGEFSCPVQPSSCHTHPCPIRASPKGQNANRAEKSSWMNPNLCHSLACSSVQVQQKIEPFKGQLENMLFAPKRWLLY